MSFFQLLFLLLALKEKLFFNWLPVGLDALVQGLMILDAALLIQSTVSIVLLLSLQNLKPLLYYVYLTLLLF